MATPTDKLSAATREALQPVRGWLRSAPKVIALTGAGISTDSGIPDFRGPQGVWTRDPDAEKLSNIHYYMNDPAIRRKAWRSRLESPALHARPNPGHLALAEMERRNRLDTLITQNIDGLHVMAGNTPENVVELHGTMRFVRCMSCSYRVPMDEVSKRLQAGEDDPDCPDCGGILKSATISFGQNLLPEDLARAEKAAATCDLLLAIGTTLSVYPAAEAVPIAKRANARVVIINGGPTEMDHLADRLLTGPIGPILQALVAGLD